MLIVNNLTADRQQLLKTSSADLAVKKADESKSLPHAFIEIWDTEKSNVVWRSVAGKVVLNTLN